MNRSFSKLNKLKIKLLALFVSLMVILEAGLMTGDTFANKDNIEVSNNLVAIDSDTNTETFEVNIKGEDISKNEAADIVLCIDTSANMNQEKGTVPNQYTKLDKVKEAVREFCKGFTDAKTGNLIENVRIAICEFGHELNQNVKERNDHVKVDSTYYKAGDMVKGSKDDAKEICALTNNIEEINKSLDTLNKSKQGVINLQAGIEYAGKILKENNARKYIVLFTNGAPTISNNHGYGKSYENVYAKAGDEKPSGQNIESLAYFKDGKWNRCLKGKLNDVHFEGAKKAYSNLLRGISGMMPQNAPEYKNDELKVYSICDTSDLNKKDEENKGTMNFPYDEKSEYGKVNSLLQSINNTDGFKEVVDINKVSDSFNEVEKSIEKDSGIYPLTNTKCEAAIDEECILPSADELKGQLVEEINKKIIKDIEVDSSNRKILFTLGDVKSTELEFKYNLKYGNNTEASYEASYEAAKFGASADSGIYELTLNIQEKLYDYKGNQMNAPCLSKEAQEALTKNPRTVVKNEIYTTYPVLLRGDKGTAYNFKLEPTDINADKKLTMKCVMKEDSVSIKDANLSVGVINMETYKISEIVPMFNELTRVRVITTKDDGTKNEVIYEGNNLNNACAKVEKGVTDISIILENRMVEKLCWFSKSYVEAEYKYHSYQDEE